MALIGASAAASVLLNRLLLPDGVSRTLPTSALRRAADLPLSLMKRLRALPGPG